MNDDDLLAELRRMWTDLDPVPPGLGDAILTRLAPELDDDDVELLALLEPAAVGAHLRGPATAEQHSFTLGGVEVLLRIGDPVDGRRRIDGWLAPGAPGTALLLIGTTVLEATVEATGRFAFPAVAPGTVRLELRLADRRLRTPPFAI